MSTHSSPSSRMPSPPSGNPLHAPPTPTTPVTGSSTSGHTRPRARTPTESEIRRRRRRSTNYLPPINPITMMEEDNLNEEQRLGVVACDVEEGVTEGSQQRTPPANDPEASGDVTSGPVRRSGLRRRLKPAPFAPAPTTVARKRASAAKTSSPSVLTSSTSIPPTPTASTSSAPTLTPNTPTASTSTASTLIATNSTASSSTASPSTPSTSTPPSSTAAVTPTASTKRRKRERQAASHPYASDSLVSTGERAETSTVSQRVGSAPSRSISHSDNETRPNSRVRPRGSAPRRINRAERTVHPVNPSSAPSAAEVPSEEAAVHALMHMQHDRYQREGAEPCFPPQHAQQPHVHQHQHQHQHQHRHQSQHQYEHQHQHQHELHYEHQHQHQPQHQNEHHYEHQLEHPHEHHYHHELQHQYGENHDLIQHHTFSQPLRASSRQDHSPDHLANTHRYNDGQHTPQNLHLQAHGYMPHHHHTSDAFIGNTFTNAHDQDACATYHERPIPESRGFQSHHQHHGPPNPQHCAHHIQPLAPAEMHFQHGHYPTHPLIIPPEVIDRTLRLHQAFYDWGFVEGFGSVLDQRVHDHDQQHHQRQVEYQKRWAMYERGLQVGIALAQEQQQQLQDDPMHWDPTYSPPPSPPPPPQWQQPSQYTAAAPLSPQPALLDVPPIILPPLPAKDPLPRVPLGQVTLPALQAQSNLPESLDQDWCTLPKITTFPPTTPPRDVA
ncbi:unnamed protein product [Mortierella alpina]